MLTVENVVSLEGVSRALHHSGMCLLPERATLARFISAQVALKPLKTNEEQCSPFAKISSTVVSEEVVDIFGTVGLDKPNIRILADNFLNEVRNFPERNLAVELRERLLEGNQEPLCK